MLQDLEVFRNIFMYAYSGRQYWEIKYSMSFDDIFNKMKVKLLKSLDCTVDAFSKYFFEELKDLIIDNHFWIGNNWLGRHKNAYFADVIVEKCNNENSVTVLFCIQIIQKIAMKMNLTIIGHIKKRCILIFQKLNLTARFVSL